MKRNISLARAPSPTNTAYSGFSNYRTDSYKPKSKADLASTSQTDSRSVARAHYEEMSQFLANHMAKEPANARSSAREKLTRLTKQQFQELSTDVYDELMRRKNNSENEEVPFLPVRDDFHPKRNQARQKLATLPKTRFKDLSSDVFYELGRRYPEFHEPETPFTPEVTSPGSTYEELEFPPYDLPLSPLSAKSPAVRSTSISDHKLGSSRRPSEDGMRRRVFDENGRNDEESSGIMRQINEDGHVRDVQLSSAGSGRRKPSQDIVQGLRNEERRRQSPDIISSGRKSSDDQERGVLGRKPSATASTASDSNTSSANAQREIIIPNKSTIAEESIEVPYGRERESLGTTIDGRRSASPGDRRPEAISRQTEAIRTPQSPPIGLGGLGNRLRDQVVQDEDEEEGNMSGGRSGDDYYDQMSFGRVSVASDRSGTGVLRSNTGRSSKAGGENVEGIRRDYEFKLATMQSKIINLERELEDAGERERRLRELAGDDKVATMAAELKALTEKMEAQSNKMVSLQQEIDNLLQVRAADKERERHRAEDDSREIDNLKDQIEALESERMNGGSMMDPENVDQLRSDLEGLINELADLSSRNEALVIDKEKDAAIIQTLEAQLAEYKRKYEAAKVDLRSYRAASQLFLPPPKSDFDLYVRPDGGVLDVHATSFITAINDLISTSRSETPSRVLVTMKTVLDAVTSVLNDVREFEHRQSDDTEFDVHAVHALTARTEATLSNLVTASKTYATSSGMSPVSLLDAAASHLSAAVTELGGVVGVKKTTYNEREQMLAKPSPQSFRTLYDTSQNNGSEQPRKYDVGTKVRSSFERGGLINEMSSSESDRNSSPRNHISSLKPERDVADSDVVTPAEGPDEAWAELKPYLEAQSESIVYAIQSVLSSVRSPNPAPALNEHLTQIITIVSSIVAVCKDNIPPATAAQGQDILRELSDHANKLSEVQLQGGLTKESRQVMAKSSFAIANAMKILMKM